MKKEIRAKFRQSVLERDSYKCKVCNKLGKCRQTSKTIHKGELVELDVHHITDRHDMPNGGYVPENGITLCSDCHISAEQAQEGFEPENLYDLIGSSRDAAIKSSIGELK